MYIVESRSDLSDMKYSFMSEKLKSCPSLQLKKLGVMIIPT